MRYLFLILAIYGSSLAFVSAGKSSTKPVAKPAGYHASKKYHNSRSADDGSDDGEGTAPPPDTPGAMTPEKFTAMQGSCDPKVCLRAGYCKTFARCGASVFESTKCPVDMTDAKKPNSLYWNMEKHTMHGGVCDLWDSLSPELKKIYIDDFTCVPPCSYKEKSKCSPEYIYSEGGPFAIEYELSCNPPLVYNKDLQTCDFCSNLGCCDGGAAPAPAPAPAGGDPPAGSRRAGSRSGANFWRNRAAVGEEVGNIGKKHWHKLKDGSLVPCTDEEEGHTDEE